jgi:hypothetical protein
MIDEYVSGVFHSSISESMSRGETRKFWEVIYFPPYCLDIFRESVTNMVEQKIDMVVRVLDIFCHSFFHPVLSFVFSELFSIFLSHTQKKFDVLEFDEDCLDVKR